MKMVPLFDNVWKGSWPELIAHWPCACFYFKAEVKMRRNARTDNRL